MSVLDTLLQEISKKKNEYTKKASFKKFKLLIYLDVMTFCKLKEDPNIKKYINVIQKTGQVYFVGYPIYVVTINEKHMKVIKED